ncbi:cytochrome P450 [Thermocoleostomius sinensis]|uniref:Cytochrome P450 n=1 Tax=Thermocoleostomius sinensis A174 TaxID=2016057 RepID=A0A9E9C938_9CYAN|nr:cytochrome P450 [Thermocoleostomius sinensis]WAL62134.1 cytochrome P450 [Thermocoleostomius sinensis A174]
MMKLIARPLEYLEDYGQRYGDMFRVGNSRPPVVYVSNPKAIQEIFATSPDCFQTGGGGKVLQLLLGEQSVVLLDGDRHQRQRKLLMPPFHGDRLRAYSQLICDTTQHVTTAQWQTGKPFRVRLTMQEITLRVILKAVFGISEGERYDQLRVLLSSLLDSIGSPLSASLIFFGALQQDWGAWSPWGRFLRLKQRVDRLLLDEIHDRQTSQVVGDDILSLLLSARDEAGQPMTDLELRDELVTLLLAGHETTASALSWALYWVHYLPEIQEKLRSELANLGPQPQPSALARLPYLTAVCQETLRIYPVTLTTGVRVLKAPMAILNYNIEAGTVLFPCTYLLHHRDDLYPDSKQFQPERFLERSFAAHEFIPFGGGHRYCIGAAMAMLEMKLVLATVLLNWQLSLVNPRSIRPVRRGLTVAPPANLQLIAISSLH